MTVRRALAVGVLVALAVVCQVSVLSRLPLPGGPPELVVLVVAVVALRDGPVAGMLAGFAGGLLADLIPPSDSPLARSALVLVVVGELVGVLRRRWAGWVHRMLLVAVATVLAGFAEAGLALVLGAGGGGGLLPRVATATGYNLVLAPVLLVLVGAGGSGAVAMGRSLGRPWVNGRRRSPVRSSAPVGGLR